MPMESLGKIFLRVVMDIRMIDRVEILSELAWREFERDRELDNETNA
jgi:hypothetical protein